MRVHAINTSMTSRLMVHTYDHIEMYADPDDFVVGFGEHVGKATRVRHIQSLVYPPQPKGVNGTHELFKLFDWMNSRSFRPENILIVYTSFFPGSFYLWNNEGTSFPPFDPFFQLEFCFTQRYGMHESEGFPFKHQVMPWAD